MQPKKTDKKPAGWLDPKIYDPDATIGRNVVHYDGMTWEQWEKAYQKDMRRHLELRKKYGE